MGNTIAIISRLQQFFSLTYSKFYTESESNNNKTKKDKRIIKMLKKVAKSLKLKFYTFLELHVVTYIIKIIYSILKIINKV